MWMNMMAIKVILSICVTLVTINGNPIEDSLNNSMSLKWMVKNDKQTTSYHHIGYQRSFSILSQPLQNESQPQYSIHNINGEHVVPNSSILEFYALKNSIKKNTSPRSRHTIPGNSIILKITHKHLTNIHM